MSWIALRMLTGDRSKYLGLIFGVTFATLLMTQQVSIFMGILARTGNQILDVRDADIWVMDNRVRYLDEAPGLQDIDLMRVRGVPGVAWAVRTYRGVVRARLEDGNTRNVRLSGLDDESLVGAPQEMIAGSMDDLNRPDAVIIDRAGYEYMWGPPAASSSQGGDNGGYQLGRTFQLNDKRAVLVGVCKVAQPFFSDPIIYTRYSQAAFYVPRERNLMNYILVKAQDGVDQKELCGRIEERTGRVALTGRQFFWKTVSYFLSSTGIPVNFGITIALGFIVGAAVTGQTLYLFIVESLKQFGALKAMGIPNRGILWMIVLQAVLVGGIGYGMGVGLTAVFFITTGNITHLAGLHMTWVALLGTGAAVVVIVIATSVISARRVLTLEPAVVFRG
ncbi:MAG: ABC transporter permease [Gemmataceae bacterium]|nr:ABC transporter permease [Gemmataceae bacterium]